MVYMDHYDLWLQNEFHYEYNIDGYRGTIAEQSPCIWYVWVTRPKSLVMGMGSLALSSSPVSRTSNSIHPIPDPISSHSPQRPDSTNTRISHHPQLQLHRSKSRWRSIRLNQSRGIVRCMTLVRWKYGVDSVVSVYIPVLALMPYVTPIV